MSHERWHVIEKIQVEIAAVAALAIMYYAAWPILRPANVDGALVFLPIGAWGSLLNFALIVWVLAAVCAVLTISSRLEGAMLSLLIGVAGGSLRTAPMRLLLNRFEDNLSGLMGALAGEVAAMVVILMIAMMIIRVVHKGLGSICPQWMRPADLFVAAPGPKAGSAKAAPTMSERAVSMAASFGITLIVGLLLMIVTLKTTGSTDRGQILFSLAISFLLGAGFANFFFPAGFPMACWLAPLVLAFVVYLRASGTVATPPLTWSHVDVWALILPIDWLSAGAGGAVGGYWISRRWHEYKHIAAAADAQ